MNPTTPGWYPDPQGTGDERWFDGTNWSVDNVRPAQAPQAPQAGSMPPPPAVPDYGQPPTEPPYGQQYGAPVPPVTSYAPQPGASNTLSIIGIVCGAIAFIFCPPLFGIAGIVLGIVAKRKGERLSTIAIVVSAAGLVLGIVISASIFLAARN